MNFLSILGVRVEVGGAFSNAKTIVFILASPWVKSNWKVIEGHSLSKE